MKTKKIISMLIACTILLAIACAGCQMQKDLTADTPAASATATAKATDGAQETESGPKGNILVWAMGAEGENMATIAAKFQKDNPGLTVDAQIIGWGQAHDKFVTAIAAKVGPDAAQIGSTWVAEFGETGTLADMSQFVEKYPNLAPENFTEGVVNLCTYKGKYCAIPWYIDEDVLFYRTDLLKAVGYDKAPATWEELKDCADKLAQVGGEGKYGFGNMDPRSSNRLYQFMWQNGADILVNGAGAVNTPEAIEAVNFFKSFFDSGATPVTADAGVSLVEGFRTGVYPMFFGGPWIINEIKKSAPEIVGKYATAVLPSKKNNISNIGGCELATFTFSVNQEAGVKFIDYMSQADTQVSWLELTNDFPAAVGAWSSDALISDPIMTTFGEQLKNVKSTPDVKQYSQIETAIRDSLEKIIVGKEDVTQTMNDCNDKINQIMKQ